ncbi:MAG: hypothetical protein LBP59_19415 [Planctomycetaceae bacterium]|nr:hypothetical protein [Planctomycetaceae bacterium]
MGQFFVTKKLLSSFLKNYFISPISLTLMVTSKLFALEFSFTVACLAFGRQAKVNVISSVNSLKSIV